MKYYISNVFIYFSTFELESEIPTVSSRIAVRITNTEFHNFSGTTYTSDS